MSKATNNEPLIIFMCDGHRHHGGLGDRLSGLLSTYAYCKECNKTFKVHWTSPYELTDFLLPNKYDWILTQDKISYNVKTSSPVLITYKESLRKQQKYAQDILNKSKDLQTHVYTNMKYAHPQNFKYLFNELFKPSPRLKEAIDSETEHFLNDYISITFRFQQLLGDLEEGKFPKIKSEEKRELLIEKCIAYVELIYKREGCPKKILVTSDSSTFIKRVSQLHYVHTIKGDLVHVDFNTKEVDKMVHMKSFLDMYMIAGAKKIYSVTFPPLYHTGFPWFSSLISGHEFVEVC